MIDKTQNTQIKLEGESPASKKSELQKQSNQVHQSYQSRGCGRNWNVGSSGNSGRGWINLSWGSTNRTITPSQAFVGECEELSGAIFDMGDSY